MNTHRGEWIGMLTAVCVLLGGLLALTVRTQIEAQRPGIPNVKNVMDLQQAWDALEAKNQALKLELAQIRGNPNASSEQQRIEMLAAMLPVKGPGIQLTVTDNPEMSRSGLSNEPSSIVDAGIVHDVDLLRLVNELEAAGAEAVVINGERYGPRTAIRCAGPSININGVPKAPPFVIQAIGDPSEMMSALNLPQGPLSELTGVGCKAELRRIKVLHLPAFDGAVKFRFATSEKPVEEGAGS